MAGPVADAASASSARGTTWEGDAGGLPRMGHRLEEATMRTDTSIEKTKKQSNLEMRTQGKHTHNIRNNASETCTQRTRMHHAKAERGDPPTEQSWPDQLRLFHVRWFSLDRTCGLFGK